MVLKKKVLFSFLWVNMGGSHYPLTYDVYLYRGGCLLEEYENCSSVCKLHLRFGSCNYVKGGATGVGSSF